LNVACTRPYNADFDKLLCQKQEAWKACYLLVNKLIHEAKDNKEKFSIYIKW
jgi:hypothetical protein